MDRARLNSLVIALLAVVVGAAPCARAQSTSLRSCSPKGDHAASRARVADLPGRFVLAFVPTAGPHAGDTVVGGLQLWTPNRAQRAASAPLDHVLQGITDVQPLRIGATSAGATDSRDPSHPGVAVTHVWVGDTSGEMISVIQMLVGSTAHQRGSLLLDSLPPLLRILYTDSAGLYGTWMGSIAGVQSSGHFCALRVPPS